MVSLKLQEQEEPLYQPISDEPGVGAIVDSSAFNGNETPWDGRIDELKIIQIAF